MKKIAKTRTSHVSAITKTCTCTRSGTIFDRVLHVFNIDLNLIEKKFPISGTMIEAKEKYRGVFETKKSGDKTSSGEIGLDIRTHASPKVGQDQVSGGVSVPCRHATPVADDLWKPIFR